MDGGENGPRALAVQGWGENMNIYGYYWPNYNDLTATSLGMVVSRGDYPQMALIQASETLQFTQIYGYWNMKNTHSSFSMDIGR